MNDHIRDPSRGDRLQAARISTRCTVLGPGIRAVLWVQGCKLRCHECLAPEMWPFTGGESWRVDDLVDLFAAAPDIEGCTFSGGEPMEQASALVELVDGLRTRRDLSFMSYSGYALEQLRQTGTADQQALLDRLDLLIDGPYLPDRHTDLCWRGSDNQRLHVLSDRYRELLAGPDRRGRWMEFELLDDGSLLWSGIPPRGFRDSLSRSLNRMGIELIQGSPS